MTDSVVKKIKFTYGFERVHYQGALINLFCLVVVFHSLHEVHFFLSIRTRYLAFSGYCADGRSSEKWTKAKNIVNLDARMLQARVNIRLPKMSPLSKGRLQLFSCVHMVHGSPYRHLDTICAGRTFADTAKVITIASVEITDFLCTKYHATQCTPGLVFFVALLSVGGALHTEAAVVYH